MYEVYYLNEHDEFEKKKKKNEEIQSSLILKNHAISSEKKSKLVKHNIYEGGYTIWECTWDMLKFFHKEGFDFNNKQVLELGIYNIMLTLYDNLLFFKNISVQHYYTF